MKPLLLVGDLCADLILPYGKIKERIESLKQEKPSLDIPENYEEGVARFRGGGTVANTARLLGKMGEKPYFITNLGSDATGEYLRKDMEKLGVDLSYAVESNHGSIVCIAVMDSSGERTMFTWVPPWSDYDHYSKGMFSEVIDKGPFYLFSGGMAITNDEASGEALLSFCRNMKERGSTIIFDLNIRAETYGFVGSRKRQFFEMFDLADIVLGNGDEEFPLITETTSKMDAMMKLKATDKIIVMRNGDQPVILWDGEKISSHPVKTVHVISTVGAGDSFNAGFLRALHHGKNYKDAVEEGNLLAGYVISHKGHLEVP